MLIRRFIAYIAGISMVALLTGIRVYAQENDYAPRDYSIVPPTPEVASLLDFKEYPVDFFRGLPQISYPIFTLKAGAIQVPISLTYHSGGIRNTQKCGNAGTGWDVTCGAVIGHTVYGAPDDTPANGNSPKMQGLFHLTQDEKLFRKKLIEKPGDYDPTEIEHYFNDNYWQAELGSRYFCGATDVANDLYNLSGLGLSATFAYDDNKNIIVTSEKPLSIAHTSELPAVTDGGCDRRGYEVRTQDGLRYTFLTQDRTLHKYQYGSPFVTQMEDSIYYASAWHLDRITDLSGNSINYNYRPSEKRACDNSGNKTVRGFSSEQMKQMNLRELLSSTSTVYHPVILDRITAGGISVAFEYKTETYNEKNVPIISRIVISDGNGDKKTYQFIYSPVGIPLLTKVMCNGEPILSFEYNDGNTREMEFDYYSQDFGGYNNDNYGDLIPTVDNVGNGADRSISAEASKKAVLTKITYPTGGFSEFVWENNTAGYMGPVQISQDNNDKILLKTKTDTLRMCLDENYKKLTITGFTIDSGQQVMLDLSSYFLMNPANLMLTEYEQSHAFMLDPYNPDNPYKYPHIRFRNRAASTYDAIYFLDKETIEKDRKGDYIILTLSPGVYDVELVDPLEVEGASDFLEANMRYGDSPAGRIYLYSNRYDNSSLAKALWCGLRIRRIISSTGDINDVPLRKDFHYNTAYDPDITSGTVQMLPQYNYNYYIVYPLVIDGSGLGYGISEVYNVGETAFPASTAGSFSSIEYPEIMTCLSKEDRNEPSEYLRGMTEKYYYSSSRTFRYKDYNETKFLNYQPVGARMYTSRAFYRGNLMKKVSGSMLYSFGHTTEYDYNIYESQNQPVFTTNAFTLCDFSRTHLNKTAQPDYGIGTYTLIRYNKTVASERYQESDGLTSCKNYEYFYNNYTDHLDYDLVRSESHKNSEGDSIVTYYTYLKSGNTYLPLKETEIITCNGNIVSATRVEYSAANLPLKKYSLNENHPASGLISSTQATTAAQKNGIGYLTYEYRYNSSGNLIQINYKGLPLVSYLWGYDGLYPIIEAKNISWEQLYSAALKSGLTASQIEGQSVTTQQKVSDVAKALRLELSESEINSIAYHWLVGVAEMTDATGNSRFFNYDSQGRLEEIRDFNNYLIEKYSYHLKVYD